MTIRLTMNHNVSHVVNSTMLLYMVNSRLVYISQILEALWKSQWNYHSGITTVKLQQWNYHCSLFSFNLPRLVYNIIYRVIPDRFAY